MLDWKIYEDGKPKKEYWAVKDKKGKIHIWKKENAQKRRSQLTHYIALGEYSDIIYAKAKWSAIKEKIEND